MKGLFDDHGEEGDYTKRNEVILRNIDSFWEANSESESEDSLEGGSGGGDGGGGGGGSGSRGGGGSLSFSKLKRKIHRQYDMSIVHKYSTAMDVFVRYIQCYHVLYSEASYYCTWKLNMFMVPCLFLSTACSVLSSFQFGKGDKGDCDEGNWNNTMLLAILNGFITFMLAIVNYLKLDAHAEAHSISSYQYSKLKGQIEIYSGELLLYENESILTDPYYISDQLAMWDKHQGTLIYGNDAKKKCEERMKVYERLCAEKKTKESLFIEKVQAIMVSIKETLKNVEDNNNFALPRHIVAKYATIYSMNLFLYIKSIDTYKNVLLNDLRNVKNEMRFYTKKGRDKQPEYKEKFMTLYSRKNALLNDFFELNKGYTLIDLLLQQELANIELRKRFWVLFWIHSALQCCGGEERSMQMLPRGYKPCTHVGSCDEDGVYLLEKALKH